MNVPLGKLTNRSVEKWTSDSDNCQERRRESRVQFSSSSSLTFSLLEGKWDERAREKRPPEISEQSVSLTTLDQTFLFSSSSRFPLHRVFFFLFSSSSLGGGNGRWVSASCQEWAREVPHLISRSMFHYWTERGRKVNQKYWKNVIRLARRKSCENGMFFIIVFSRLMSWKDIADTPGWHDVIVVRFLSLSLHSKISWRTGDNSAIFFPLFLVFQIHFRFVVF